MSSKRHILLPATLLASVLAWQLVQVPVAQAQAGGGAAPGNNQVLVDLYLQVQALQTEVQNLRGIVEEQGYQLRRMEQEQRDRYLDLDRRLSALGTGGDPSGTGLPGQPGAPADIPGITAPPAGNLDAPGALGGVGGIQEPQGLAGAAGSNLDTPASAAVVQAPVAMPANEQELYRTALNLLLEQSDYEQAISLFQRYIDTYPNGPYITNAYYWQGEALILVARYNQAKDVFSKLINDYPNDPKAPGAMLKLGVVYSRMGDNRLATQVWRDIQTRYPASVTEIRAAEDYLRRAGN